MAALPDDALARQRPLGRLRLATPQTDDAVARLLAERVEQGLPARITDPATIARIACVLIQEPAIRREAG